MSHFTFFACKEQNEPSKTLTKAELWERLNQEASHEAYEDKSKAPVFAAATFGPENSRKRDNITGMTGIVLDIDKSMTLDEIQALCDKLNKLGLAYAIYSTYSSEEGAYKLRIIVLLAKPVSAETFEKERFAARLAQLLGVEIDPACERSTQVYFVPSCPPGMQSIHLSVAVEGRPLEASELPALKNAGKKKPTSKLSEDDAKEDPQALAEYIERHFSEDVPFMYSGNAFWVYIYGVRMPLNVKELESYVYNDVFGRSVKLSDVRAAIGVLKVTGYANTLPQPSDVALVNFAGTTVDLRTGAEVENSPEHNLTIMLPHAFDPEAECPRFFAFLEQVFENDPDAAAKITFLQQWMGYMLMPTAKFQKMLWMVGPGANGKSILTALMTAMLGCENVSTVPLATFGSRFSTSDLLGKLANITDEAGADYYLSDGTVKEVVGGSRIRAEHKGQDAFSFDVFARLVVSTNHLPRTKDTSHGYFRRIAILELNRIFDKSEQDPDLLEKLVEEMPGIVRFAMEGAGELLRNGSFVDLPSSDAAIERYMSEANPVRQFVAEALILDAVDPVTQTAIKVRKIDLYALFKVYCQQHGNIAPSDSIFGKRLKELGLSDVKSGGKTYWLCGFADPSGWLRQDTEIDNVLTRKIVNPENSEALPDYVTPLKAVLPRKLISADFEFEEGQASMM